MAQVTYDEVDLMLRLYELRREPRLRVARNWVVGKLNASSVEEMIAKYPPGTEENTNIRMATSYWEMVAGIWNRGLIDDDLLFENSGEAWLVWERIRPVATGWRAAAKNPHMFEHLEKMAGHIEAWREKRAPGTTDTMRQMLARMQQQAAKAARE